MLLVVEAGLREVECGTEDKRVVEAEKGVLNDLLNGAAIGHGLGVRSVIGARRGGGGRDRVAVLLDDQGRIIFFDAEIVGWRGGHRGAVAHGASQIAVSAERATHLAGIALFAGNLVTVQGRARDAAEIGIGLNRSDVADVVTAIALEEEYFVFRHVWRSEHGAPVSGEELRWGRAVADQVRVGISKIKIDLEFVARHRDVTVKPGQL